MEQNLSKKAKLVILVAVLILAFPLYALSDLGMGRWTQAAWDNAGDSESPERLLKYAKLYGLTMRKDKENDLLEEWLKHYGGDETEKDPGARYITWKPYPWSDETPRPKQKGEDYRSSPHPKTAEVLVTIAEHYEDARQYQPSQHLFEIVMNDASGLPKDDAAHERARLGIQRSRSRSF